MDSFELVEHRSKPLEHFLAAIEALPDALRHVQRSALVKSIEALPTDQRLVLSLLYVEALSYQEIGIVLGSTESHVHILHAQGLTMLTCATLPILGA